MKIRQRLALRFMLVSALLTGSIFIFIFVLTSRFVHEDFVQRLIQQSSLEVLHYATPDVREALLSESFSLVNPRISLFTKDGTLLYSKGEFPIPPEWISSLQIQEQFIAELGKYTTVGRKYNVQGNTYLVFVSDKDLPGQHELDILVKAMLMGYFFSLILSYLAGLYFSGNALLPVKRVVKEVNKITKDNLSYRLNLLNRNGILDEIGELILTFNALLTRIEDAFIAQKRFVQNASHELKTPLTSIMAETELALSRSRSVDEYKRTLEVVLSETERLERVTHGLLTLTRLEEGLYKKEVEKIHLSHLLEQTLAAFRLHHPDREVILYLAATDVIINGNEQLLHTAILNLLDNAYKYSKEKIIVSACYDRSSVKISIQDFGMGIPETDLGRIRSPLFRASNVLAFPGAGLGLSLVDRIVKVHVGSFDISSIEGQGTTCNIVLPLEYTV